MGRVCSRDVLAVPQSTVGIWLSSGAVSPITNFSTGTLYLGSGENRDELLHIRPSGIFITLVR